MCGAPGRGFRGACARVCLYQPCIHIKRSTGHTHTHTTADEQITHTNTEQAKATAQRHLIVKIVAAQKLPPSSCIHMNTYVPGQSHPSSTTAAAVADTIPEGASAADMIPEGGSEIIPKGVWEIITEGVAAAELIPEGGSEIIPVGGSEMIQEGGSETIPEEGSELIPEGVAAASSAGVRPSLSCRQAAAGARRRSSVAASDLKANGLYIYIYIHKHTHFCIYTYMYMCIYLLIHVYAHFTHTDTNPLLCSRFFFPSLTHTQSHTPTNAHDTFLPFCAGESCDYAFVSFPKRNTGEHIHTVNM